MILETAVLENTMLVEQLVHREVNERHLVASKELLVAKKLLERVQLAREVLQVLRQQAVLWSPRFERSVKSRVSCDDCVCAK